MGATVAAAPATAPAASAANRRNALATLVVLLVTGGVIFATAYLSNPAASDTANGEFTPVTVDGQPVGAAPVADLPAPDFIAATTDGTQFRLSELRGGPVWLTFGASWCQPCRAENADLQATYAANAGNITVVQVYMDEDAATVLDYTSRVGITYMTVPDPNQRLAAQYRILGIPSHFFIDATGVLRQVKVGSLDPVAMQAAIDQVRE